MSHDHESTSKKEKPDNNPATVPDQPEQEPSQLERAQSHTGNVSNGVAYPRVRYGDEKVDEGADHHPCPDCGATKGRFHILGCEIEECPRCNRSWHTCDCPFDEAVLEPGASLAILARAVHIETVKVSLSELSIPFPIKPQDRNPD